MCETFSRKLGKAVVFSGFDSDYTTFSVFANAYSRGKETRTALHIKHTKTGCSAFDFSNYRKLQLEDIFSIVYFHGFKIGMTICYDCNHALFSRMYGLQGVDVILNSTGGNVMDAKWYRYNKARAIENHCYNFVTMGETKGKNNSYVYGFNPNGGELPFVNLMKETTKTNEIGTIYKYTAVLGAEVKATADKLSGKVPTVNSRQDLLIKAGDIQGFIDKSVKVADSIYCYQLDGDKPCNVIFCIVEGDEILKAEMVLKKLYSSALKDIPDKRYILVNRYDHLGQEFYDKKLSVLLKVRAMENFCVVILESDLINQCYQSSNYKLAQVIQAVDGCFGVDLSRASGPESIWKDKNSMRAAWRENFEWLLSEV